MAETESQPPVAGAPASTQRANRGGLALASSILKVILVAGIVMTAWSAYRLEPWAPVTGSAAGARSTPVRWADVNPVGVNTFLAGEVEVWKRERTMEMIAELGAGWIRQGFHWNEIEPTKGEHWDARYQQDAWAKFDNIVDLAEQHGIRIIARLDQTPDWARPPGTDPQTPPTNHDDFGDFVFDFVSRYQGRISFIQIWNEPNLAQEWGGTIDPAGYASLLEVAARRAREADPDIVILSAPMAMTTEDSERAIDEFTYWQALYDLGIGAWFDIMSANVYGLSDPYNAEPDFDRLNTRRVELLRDLAVRNGDGEKAIWFNEYGWNASPADFPPEKLIWSRVDDSTQADWTAKGLEFAEEHWDWFGVASIWYFRHVGNLSPEDSDYYFRMVDVEFTPRDVYRTVQSFSTSVHVAGPGDHGVLRSPVTPLGTWPVRSGDHYRRGIAITGDQGATLAIRFRGSALDLHLPASESHGSIQVAIVDGTGTTAAGARWTTLDTPREGGFLTVTSHDVPHPTAESPDVRTALVRVADDSMLTVDLVRVRYQQSYFNVAVGAGVVCLAVAGIFLTGRMRRRVA